MGIQTSFHAALGQEFLGLRLSRRGAVEVVYDNGFCMGGAADRRIWKVMAAGQEACNLTLHEEAALSDVLRIAAQSPHVLATLHDEMKKRALVLETAQS